MTFSKFASAIVAFAAVAQAEFRSGGLKSLEKFGYGRFETRMKAPNKKGTAVSFFTRWDGKLPDDWSEIDFDIVPSVNYMPISTNMKYRQPEDSWTTEMQKYWYEKRFDPKDDWHTYAIEVTPRYISWSIDGKEVRKAEADSDFASNIHKEDLQLNLSFWTPSSDFKGMSGKYYFCSI